MNQKAICIIVVVFCGILALYFSKTSYREGYRDPLYLNRSKLMYDYYPRSNGSIYGLPYRYGGSWSIFSGHTYYDTAI